VHRFSSLLALAAALATGNLLVNGDFSSWDSPTQPAGWTVEDTVYARIEQSSDPSRSPAYSARITRLVAGTGNNKGVMQYIPVTAGQVYTLEAWYFDDDINARGGLSITWRTADSTYIDNSGTVYTDSAIRDWQQLGVTDTAPATAAWANALLRVYGFTGGPAGGVVYLDDAVFDEGTGAVAEPPFAATPVRIAAQPTLVLQQTTIRYSLANAGPVSLAIHDLTGAARRCLVSTIQTGGDHVITWDGRDDSGQRLADGLYFAVLRTSAGETVRKLVLELR
jgi:hypothetical protein